MRFPSQINLSFNCSFREVISESYGTVQVQAKAMRTVLRNQKLHVSSESLRYDDTIRVLDKSAWKIAIHVPEP
jgi:hypothetical protein